MPQKNSAQLSKRQKTSQANQKRAVSIALEDDDAFFGRVIKINMGRCTVNLWDHDKKRHMEVQARLPNKKKGFVRLNDLVNIARSHPDWEVQVTVDAKTANDLRKAGRISAELATELSASSAPSTEDLGIEFDYDGLEAKEAVNEDATAALSTKGGKKAAAIEEDAVDIDDI